VSFLRVSTRAPAKAGVFICALFCLLLAGCATPQLQNLQQDWPSGLPEQAQIQNVPFVAQDDYQCGPAALAMVAQHAGVSQPLATWVEQVYLPARQGSLQPEMLAAARRAGLPAYVIAPRLHDLLREVAAGNPVLVLQNLSLPVAPVWHYAVVIGYDVQAQSITLHSARTQAMVMPISTFERTWARGSHWAMLALAPSRLPATAQADAFVASAAAMERVRMADANLAYQTALARWPTHRIAMLGLGNSAYALKQLPQAAKAYQSAVNAYPDFADAWHNLAQVQSELGQAGAALQAAQRAVQLGGPRVAQYQALAQRLRGLSAPAP
jgi:tetratricopeptide (TPR) repeat protein